MTLLINVYSTLCTPPVPAFPHELNNQRNRSDPELAAHLNGFIGYVQSKSGGKMTAQCYHLIRHIERVQTQFSLNVEESEFDAFAHWALQANAVCFFPDGSVRTAEGAILVAMKGENVDENAGVPFPEDAIARKKRHDVILAEKGIRVPVSLPPVVGEGEILLRSAQEVAARCLSLFSVALRAESLASQSEKTTSEIKARLPLSFESMSAQEASFMEDISPEEQDTINFCWRYEALSLLLWSIKKSPELPFPTAICDVAQVARTVLENGEQAFLSTAQLRPSHEILDALDLHYRLHWATRQASLEGKDMPANLQEGVISERHYALNWLVKFENADWDDIDTPT